MNINPSKSKAINITPKRYLNIINYDNIQPILIGDQNMEYVDKIRNLGYHFDRTLSNEPHTNQIQQKVYGALAKTSVTL